MGHSIDYELVWRETGALEEKDFEEMKLRAKESLAKITLFLNEAHENAVEYARTGLDPNRVYRAYIVISARKITLRITRSVADSSPPHSPPVSHYAKTAAVNEYKWARSKLPL